MYTKSRQDRVKIGSKRGSQQQQQQQQGWRDLSHCLTHKPTGIHTGTHTHTHTHPPTHTHTHTHSHTLSLSLSLTHSLGQLFYEIRRSIILHLTFPFRKAKDTHGTVFFDPGLALSLFVLGDELFGSVLSHVQEFAYIYICHFTWSAYLFVFFFLFLSFSVFVVEEESSSSSSSRSRLSKKKCFRLTQGPYVPADVFLIRVDEMMLSGVPSAFGYGSQVHIALD